MKSIRLDGDLEFKDACEKTRALLGDVVIVMVMNMGDYTEVYYG